LQVAGLEGSFARLDMTSEDLSLAVNGVHVVRVYSTQINNLPLELARPEVVDRLRSARDSYSDAKVAQLLHYKPDQDYYLPPIPSVPSRRISPTSDYIAYKVFSMHPLEVEELGSIMGVSRLDSINEYSKKEIIQRLCENHGIPKELYLRALKEYSSKKMRQSLFEICNPLTTALEGKVTDEFLGIMIDSVAQRYSPDSVERMQEGVLRITSVLNELYTRRKRYGILMPKDQQLVSFFTQVAERVFGEKTDPLSMFVVACPRYGEHDEYDKLEEGLSQTASTYLYSLPLLTTVLTKNGIPYRGYILVNDTEEQMADGSLLGRLGLTKETYRAKCRGNVEAVNRAIVEDERITGVSAHLFTEVFPDFMAVTADLERQLCRLTKSDAGLRLAMAKVADTRLARHTKIMGGQCDFSDSLYLSLHYSAEYMALGYLCRLYSELNNNSLIVNYNSPNVEQFNSQELLANCTKGSALVGNLTAIPVFQVKFY